MSLPATQFAAMHTCFHGGATRGYAFRKQQLLLLRQTIRQFEPKLFEALHQDLGKSPEEAYATELGLVYAEISHALQHLQQWMKPVKVSSPLTMFPSTSKILRDPLGISLIIAPWNYPFLLLFSPLVAAIAGGNCVVLKPSELAPHTAAVAQELIKSIFPEEYITTLLGDGALLVRQLLKDYRFDHIFFTGSIPVGKTIATLAAEKLTPVTLELGGKSPCIVDETANSRVAAARIAWGKFTNAGQTCVAPDYLLVKESCRDNFIAHLQQSILEFYSLDPKRSPDYGRIVNRRRFDKLVSYLPQGRILSGGYVDADELFISPTLMDQVRPSQPVMQEEIFGPLLPVYTYRSNEEAAAFIQQHSNPLALYVFSNNSDTSRFFTEQLSFGGGCINNTLVHLSNLNLPFGGVGNSGTGQYHGQFGFEAFTRPKALVQTRNWPDPSIKYPPYAGRLKWLKRILK